MCRLDVLVPRIIAQPTCVLWILLIQDWCLSSRTQQQETKRWHRYGEEAMERLSGLRLETAQRRRHKCSGCSMALQFFSCMVTAYCVPSAARPMSHVWAGGARRRPRHGPGMSWAPPAPWRKQRRDVRGKVGWKHFYPKLCSGCADITSACRRVKVSASRRVCKPFPKGKWGPKVSEHGFLRGNECIAFLRAGLRAVGGGKHKVACLKVTSDLSCFYICRQHFSNETKRGGIKKIQWEIIIKNPRAETEQRAQAVWQFQFSLRQCFLGLITFSFCWRASFPCHKSQTPAASAHLSTPTPVPESLYEAVGRLNFRWEGDDDSVAPCWREQLKLEETVVWYG